jgi:uncharacterized membrane protein
MSAFEQLALAQALFVGSHLLLCTTPIRSRIVARIGVGPWRLFYSLLSLYLLRPLPWLYWVTRHQGPLYWVLPWNPLTQALVTLLASGGVIGIVASLLQPSPAAILPGKPQVQGVMRITRHPMMMGIASVCFAHLLAFGYLSDVLFFGGLLLLALVGAWHQDRRKLRSPNSDIAEFYQQTNFWPFTTPGRLQALRELGLLPVVLGTLMAWGIRWGHRWIP